MLVRLLAIVFMLAGYVAMDVLTGVKLWLLVRPVKRIRAAIQRKRTAKRMASWRAEHPAIDEVLEDFNSDDKETVVLNGKLTYSAQVGMAIVFVGQLLGVDITTEAAASIVGVVLAVVGVYGRWRATKSE